MTIFFTILLCTVIIVFIITGILYLIEERLGFIAALLITIFIICVCDLYSKQEESEYNSKIEQLKKPKIDLPEEYKAITNQIKKPDTLLAYWYDDTLRIEFKNK